MIIQESDLCHKTANQLKERKPMHIFIPFKLISCVNNNENFIKTAMYKLYVLVLDVRHAEKTKLQIEVLIIQRKFNTSVCYWIITENHCNRKPE